MLGVAADQAWGCIYTCRCFTKSLRWTADAACGGCRRTSTDYGPHTCSKYSFTWLLWGIEKMSCSMKTVKMHRTFWDNDVSRVHPPTSDSRQRSSTVILLQLQLSLQSHSWNKSIKILTDNTESICLSSVPKWIHWRKPWLSNKVHWPKS